MACEPQGVSYGRFEVVAPTLDSLRRLFQTQIQNLISKRYPDATGMSDGEFLSHVSPLKDKLALSKRLIGPGLYFVVVIPESFVSIPKQISLLSSGIEPLTKAFSPAYIRDLSGLKTPRIPYLAIDIQVESGIQPASPRQSLRRLQRAGRSGLTVVEGIALALHFPRVLVRSCIDLLGSRCMGDFPYLCRGINDKAELGLGDADDADAQWAAASCYARLAM